MKDALGNPVKDGDTVVFTDSTHNVYTGEVTKVTTKVIHINGYQYRKPSGVIVLKSAESVEV